MWILQFPFKLNFKSTSKFINLIALFLAGCLLAIASNFIFITPHAIAQIPQTPQNTSVSDRAPIVVDGIPLFYLQSTDRFGAMERTQFANKILAEAIANDQIIKLNVRNDEIKLATSITLNNNYLLTVTAPDILPNFSASKQAEQWQVLLEEAIAKAKNERTSPYLWQRGLWILIACAIVAGIQFLTVILTRIFKLKLQLFGTLFLSLAWGAIVAVSSEWFPILRSIRYYFLSPFTQPQWLIFFGSLGFSIVFSYYATGLMRLLIKKAAPQTIETIYVEIIQPIDRLVQVAVLSICLNWSFSLLEPLVPVVYNLIKPIASLFLIISLYWLLTNLASRYLRTFGFKIGGKFSTNSDDAILVFETVFNVLIFIVALVAFARSLNFDLIGLVASLGLVGLAVAFAAQKILEQLIATLVLYLDRPFVTGDYIRLPAGELGKVESIGLRSTKIRSLGTGTIIIMPNSILVSVEIENVSLAKKIMVLLYMDFVTELGEREQALVQQVITEKTASLSGIDANSTSIADADGSGKRLRVSFAILGSQENAIEVRKRLLELASAEIIKALAVHGIVFTMEEPTIYVQSPVTI
jgi:small-conductance mechanosensitive channel